jgi:hypothetical protein
LWGCGSERFRDLLSNPKPFAYGKSKSDHFTFGESDRFTFDESFARWWKCEPKSEPFT